MHGVQERWIQWWCAPWQWAHPEWAARFFASGGTALMDGEALLRNRHDEFLRSVGIQPSQPPEPIEPMLQWLQLNVDQRQLALALAARICLAHCTAQIDDNSAVHEAWCRSVAKALRPGLWLAPRVDDPRLLLAAWTGESCWSRLRLNWPPGEMEDAYVSMPANKLQTLWQSVLWRVTASS